MTNTQYKLDMKERTELARQQFRFNKVGWQNCDGCDAKRECIETPQGTVECWACTLGFYLSGGCSAR